MKQTCPRLLALAALFFLLAVNHPQTAAAQYLTVDGEVTTPLNLSEADFKKLPRTTAKVKDAGGHDVTYQGVDLAELLRRAGVPLKDDLKGADVAKYLHTEGSDGFAAVISLPEFDDAAFLVADVLNGAPLPTDAGPLQLISLNEKRHSRWVKHLILLRVKKTQR